MQILTWLRPELAFDSSKEWLLGACEVRQDLVKLRMLLH
jgi:hypothetical protein